MKRLIIVFVLIILCLSLLLFKGKAYTQVDLSKILDQSNLYTLPPYLTLYPYYQSSPSFQLPSMVIPTMPYISDYSFLFGSNWNLWQIYGLNNLTYPFTSTPKKPGSSKQTQPKLSEQGTTLDSTIKFSATADKSTYDSAELIEITLMLENNGSEDVTIEFPSEQKFDVKVKEKSGETVRHLSQDIQGAQPSTTLTLESGGTETSHFQWNQEDDDGMIVQSGTYTIDVSLSSTEPQYQKPISITISIKVLPRFTNCTKLKETLKVFYDKLYPSLSPSPTPSPKPGPSKVSTPAYGGYYGGLYGGFGGLYGGGYGMAISGGYNSYMSFSNIGYSAGGLYGSFAGIGGYSLGSYGTTGLSGVNAAIGGYGLGSSYGIGLYGSSASYGLAGYGSLSANYGGIGGYGGLSNYSLTGLSGNYGGYTGFSGFYRLKTTSDVQIRGKENNDNEFSTTNVQVVGVDEADIVKNDGTYIYKIKGKTVQIIQASPADAMQMVNVISIGDKIDFYPERLYVKGDTLVLIGDEPVPDSISYFSTPTPGTRIYIYDITDRTNEILTRKFIFWGEYVQSRMAGDTLYIIMNEPAPLKRFDGTLTDLQVLLPHFHDSYFNGNDENNDEILCDCNEVAYLPEHLSPNYFVVIGIPLDDHTKAIGREVIMGKSDKVYATTENLYVTSEYDSNQPTNIYKFWLDGETIAFGNSAQMSGRIINQFSMDEYEDHLRVATISGSGPQAENNIYVFDSGMKKTGSLEDFTSGGTIKSIRFIDDRCYAVISRELLPLSVISFTDPSSPGGPEFLDIFGNTDYLQPVDKNLLLGFGREIIWNTETGMKISLYDITDTSDPQEISEDEIVSLNTESEVLSDHKALLLSMGKNLMAFPVTVRESSYLFQGAYVYYIDDNGFERIEEGLTHYPEQTIPIDSYNVTSPNNISIIIYMGDYYYAISDNRITARDILTHTETFSLSLE
ncbi:MAG: beta-propeller domain-containing protein [bacterium]